MSLEAKIEELSGTVAALTALMQQQVTIQERLLAGQEKALATVAEGNPTTATKRGRKPKDADTQTTSEEPADTASGAGDAESASDAPGTADAADETPPAADKPKLTFGGAAKKWLEKEAAGTDAYKARGKTIMGILANFGAAKMSELNEADEPKAMFYLKRAAKGCTINFDAAYDFAGEPDQAEPVAAADSSDDDNMFD
jgi:hypothetical protein